MTYTTTYTHGNKRFRLSIDVETGELIDYEFLGLAKTDPRILRKLQQQADLGREARTHAKYGYRRNNGRKGRSSAGFTVNTTL